MTLENMSAHGFMENGFYWDGVEGFAGRYLTVWNVGLYAIYAIESRDGIIEHSYASGAADAAFYIGECNPCDTVVRDRHGGAVRGRLLGHERRREPRGRGLPLREQRHRHPAELVRGRARAAAAARRDLPTQRRDRQRQRADAARDAARRVPRDRHRGRSAASATSSRTTR